jgi:WD40 repeat protein
LILRSEDFRGINIYTLEDGALISKIEKMHSKAIISICLLDDMKTLISAGKDKKIKVWNIANY